MGAAARPPEAMHKLHHRIGKLETAIAGTFLVLMVGLVFLGGLARLAAQPLNWTIDFATCLFAWASFLCADIAWRQDGLMSIELLTGRLPARLQKLCLYVNYIVISGFLVYLIVAGIWLSWVSRARSFQGIPEISYSWVTMSLPVGGALLLLTTLLKLSDRIGQDASTVRKSS
jgi:TRAP-type C4-dicarboxylate transport system permease small subunit